MQLIQNLCENYAHISATDMEANDECLRSPYNAEERLKGLIKRLNQCADFVAAASKAVSETQIVRIAYRLVAETGQYPEDCCMWMTQYDKFLTAFQDHSIEAQADLKERRQTLCQGGYGADNLVGIEEDSTNLTQETAEDKAAVTYITGSNINLTTQVAEYANHMATNYSEMVTMQKTISHFQGEIKTLKSKLSG